MVHPFTCHSSWGWLSNRIQSDAAIRRETETAWIFRPAVRGVFQRSGTPSAAGHVSWAPVSPFVRPSELWRGESCPTHALRRTVKDSSAPKAKRLRSSSHARDRPHISSTQTVKALPPLRAQGKSARKKGPWSNFSGHPRERFDHGPVAIPDCSRQTGEPCAP